MKEGGATIPGPPSGANSRGAQMTRTGPIGQSTLTCKLANTSDAHGEQDTRVLPSQSKAMVKALKALGKPVEWLPFERQGHGFFWVNNHVRYLKAVLDFLQRHIREQPAGAP